MLILIGCPSVVAAVAACSAACGSASTGGGPGANGDGGGTRPDATMGSDAASSMPDAAGATSDAGGDSFSIGDGAADGGGAGFTITPGAEKVVATYAQRAALGFRFGFADGLLGALRDDAGAYTFYGSGETWRDAGTCPGSPGVQGAYRFGTAIDSITTNFGCNALVRDREGGAPLTDGGVLGYFDRDYVGGGQVMRITSAGRHGVIMTYHAEFHWGPVCGGAPCFYGTLGMAVSTDDGATFQSLGEIVQPYVTRPVAVAAGRDVPIHTGPFVLGDAAGHPVDPATADPATTYIYVLFPDQDPSATCGGSASCIAVARALEADVAASALAGSTPVFKKFYQGAFTEPAICGDPNDAVNSGHFTPVLAVAGFEPTVIYDRTIQQFLLVTKRTVGTPPTQFFLDVRASADVTSWPTATVQVISDANLENRYPSLIGDDPNPMVGGAHPWLFFTQNAWGAPWAMSTFMNVPLNIALTP
jgi:hypothetical protein